MRPFAPISLAALLSVSPFVFAQTPVGTPTPSPVPVQTPVPGGAVAVSVNAP